MWLRVGCLPLRISRLDGTLRLMAAMGMAWTATSVVSCRVVSCGLLAAGVGDVGRCWDAELKKFSRQAPCLCQAAHSTASTAARVSDGASRIGLHRQQFQVDSPSCSSLRCFCATRTLHGTPCFRFCSRIPIPICFRFLSWRPRARASGTARHHMPISKQSSDK